MKYNYHKVTIAMPENMSIHGLRKWCRDRFGRGKVAGEWDFFWYAREDFKSSDDIVHFYFKESEHAILFRLAWS